MSGLSKLSIESWCLRKLTRGHSLLKETQKKIILKNIVFGAYDNKALTNTPTMIGR